VSEGSTETPQGVGRGGKELGHVPVLLKEAITFLAVRRGGAYIDATVGLGGHSWEIAKRLGAAGHLIGFDKDPGALEKAREKLAGLPAGEAPEVELIYGSFAEITQRCEPRSADGILADLGVSSLQLDNATRGFSFQADGFLDMRMNPQSERTAEQVVNQMDEVTLANLIYEFGEERRSRRIARAIVRSRPISTTAQLAAVISAAARPMNRAERRIHPATRTFQALRIFVNHELDDLRELLQSAPQMLRPGGRLVVISFHSLEDRIVKDAMREGAKLGQYKLLSKKPVMASEEEIERNPRARSAKLRAAERVNEFKQKQIPRG
jgi:16S rRNA (cytosine1402-N4)-methyltransferase